MERIGDGGRVWRVAGLRSKPRRVENAEGRLQPKIREHSLGKILREIVVWRIRREIIKSNDGDD